MGLVYSRTDGGLVVASHGADEAAVAAALKRHDPMLELSRQADPEYGCWAWTVLRRTPTGGVEAVVHWREGGHGQPYPLSMRLVDEVQKHDRGTRGRVETIAEAEEKHRAETEKDYRRDMDEIVREFGPKLDGKRYVPQPRSQRLRMGRDKRRARGENV